MNGCVVVVSSPLGPAPVLGPFWSNHRLLVQMHFCPHWSWSNHGGPAWSTAPRTCSIQNSDRGCRRARSDAIALKDPSQTPISRLPTHTLPFPHRLAGSHLRWKEGEVEEGREKERERCPISLNARKDF